MPTHARQAQRQTRWIAQLTAGLVLVLPGVALAQTASLFLGFFNICAGLMVVAAFLVFIGGFLRYLVVLGTDHRKEGLNYMVWGVTILFVLVVLLAIVNMLQGPLAFVIGIAIALFVCFAIVLSLAK